MPSYFGAYASSYPAYKGPASPVTPLPAPTGLAVTPTSATSIGVSYNPVANATGYRLQRATVTNGTVGSYSTVYEGTATSYTDTVSASATYAYKVLAIGGGNYSASGYSAAVQGTTPGAQGKGYQSTYTDTIPADA